MKIQEVLKKNDTNLSAKEIEEFVKKESILLSDEYIEFISMYDKGTVQLDNILIRKIIGAGLTQDFYLGGFLSFLEFTDNYDYYYNVNLEEEIVNVAVAIIGRTNGRTSICIGIQKENLGQIFLWDGDFGVIKQAESLSDFFDSLVLDESNV